MRPSRLCRSFVGALLGIAVAQNDLLHEHLLEERIWRVRGPQNLELEKQRAVRQGLIPFEDPVV